MARKECHVRGLLSEPLSLRNLSGPKSKTAGAIQPVKWFVEGCACLRITNRRKAQRRAPIGFGCSVLMAGGRRLRRELHRIGLAIGTQAV